MSFLPVHPALVHLPIAFVLLSVVADVCARLAKSEARRVGFRTIGFWSLLAGLTGGVCWQLPPDIWMHEPCGTAMSEMHRFCGELHVTIGWVCSGACLVVLSAWRWLIWHRGQMTINTAYLVGAFLVLGITLFRRVGAGSEMVYSYGAGVAAAGQGTENRARVVRTLDGRAEHSRAGNCRRRG